MYRISRKKLSVSNRLILILNVMITFSLLFLIFKDEDASSEQPNDFAILSTLLQRAENLKAFCQEQIKTGFIDTDKKHQFGNKNEHESKLDLSTAFNFTSTKFIDVANDMTYCLVPKVAAKLMSSTFLLEEQAENFKERRKRNIEKNLHLRFQNSSSKLPKDFDDNDDKVKSFIIVRHPFERLVLLYLYFTGIIKHDEDYMDVLYTLVMNEKHPNAVWDLNSEHDLVEDKGLPSFEDFVDYVLKKELDAFVPFVKPIWLLCDVCERDYSFVVKYENLEAELPVLVNYLKKVGQIPVEVEIEWKKMTNEFPKETKILTREYFWSLPKKKTQSLYETYKNDFLFFNYSISR
ncbi:UNVERIFIED_CONTAM: hypothetical protein RMT77_009283 [Armadillidium vulgare]